MEDNTNNKAMTVREAFLKLLETDPRCRLATTSGTITAIIGGRPATTAKNTDTDVAETK